MNVRGRAGGDARDIRICIYTARFLSFVSVHIVLAEALQLFLLCLVHLALSLSPLYSLTFPH